METCGYCREFAEPVYGEYDGSGKMVYMCAICGIKELKRGEG